MAEYSPNRTPARAQSPTPVMTPLTGACLMAGIFVAAIAVCDPTLEVRGEEARPLSGFLALDAITVQTPDGKRFALVGYAAPRTATCLGELDAGTRAKKLLQRLLDTGAMLLAPDAIRLVESGTHDARGLPQASLYIVGKDVADIMIAEQAARRDSGGKHESWCEPPTR
jgi:hypothetical protein